MGLAPAPALREQGPKQRLRFLLAAQFCSALADHALLIVAIALLLLQGWPAWWVPVLKVALTAAYVLLAPWVGVWADRWPKPRVMMASNGLKAAAVLLLLLGLPAPLALALVGVAAAAYAPAKYGLATELAGPQRLVAANGWLEGSTVCAALLGTALGGWLVGSAAAAMLAGAGWPGPAWQGAVLALLLLYLVAAVLNLSVPDSGVRATGPALPSSARAFAADLWQAQRRLWRDPLGGLSLAVTAWVWGVAAVLQLLLLRWGMEALALTLEQATRLQVAVALGVVAGAALAGRFVKLEQATRLLPLGLVLGLLVPAVALLLEVQLACALLAVCGALAGALVVPMNALLQRRGQLLLSTGRSVAVQNFNENLSVLLMLAIYAALLAGDVGVVAVLWGLGGLTLLVMAALTRWARQVLRVAETPAATAHPPEGAGPPAGPESGRRAAPAGNCLPPGR